MPTLELSADQVIELVKQLPDRDKRAVLDALAKERESWWTETALKGEAEMRRLATERGLTWDRMSEAERESFVDTLLHEAA
jgi:putative PIN family toxin of toxin-antitoxin system